MRCSVAALALAVALSTALAGCTPTICGRTSECPSGQVCTAAGVCAVPADAAGSGDGGSAALGDGAPADAAPDGSAAAARVPIDNEGHGDP